MEQLTYAKSRIESGAFVPLWTIVYDYCSSNIVDLSWKPLSKLSEVQLANELNISRSPIKQALDRLVEEGLLEKREGKGYLVTPIIYEDCRQLSEARIALESHAAYLAAKTITQPQLEALEKILVQQNAAMAEDFSLFPILDHRFHQVIIDAACNKNISSMYSSISKQLLRFRHHIPQKVNIANLHDGRAYHQSIVNALKLHLSEVARREIILDIQTMLNYFV